jgi:hypothetical protein
MYKAQTEQSPGPEAAAQPHHDDKVVDAEFEEVDDKKKSG